jgi:uncharacterized protein (DUF2384 family)
MTSNLQKIRDKATDVLGSEERADDWIDHNSATLGGSPRSLSDTNEGTLRVLLHLATVSRHSFN